ncbi:alpha-glucuronidase, partial [Pediococcus acidilactici]|nr:alpha-glucuronidase [Pediococcus acidilactici]
MIRTNTQFADLKKPVVAEALAETAIDQKNTGFAAVANVGMSPFWTGNPLALANLYGYGRLCWDNFKDVHEILTEWIEQSVSTSLKQTIEIIFDIL